MKRALYPLVAFVVLSTQVGQATAADKKQSPPEAKKIDHIMEAHGVKRNDPYYWLRDDTREDKEMLAYLEAENTYAATQLAGAEALADTVFDEIVGRLEQNTSTVPAYDNGYWYTRRYEEGKEHPIFERRKGSETAPVELLLDANIEAARHDYYAVGGTEVSPDNRWLAYTEDLVSRRQYQLRFKNLETGQLSDTVIPNLEPGVAWSNDSKHIYYLNKHPDTLLGYQLYRHRLGTDPASDVLVYEEEDDTYYSGLGRSRSGDYILLWQRGSAKGATAALDANNSDAKPVFLAPRSNDFEFYADHLGDRFFIRHNIDAPNFKISTVAADAIGDPAKWRDLVPHDEAILIESVELFDGVLALQYREQGQVKLRVLDLESGKSRPVNVADEVYEIGFTGNASADVSNLRFSYSSMTTPRSVIDYDLKTGKQTQRKQQKIPSGWDGDKYKVERVYATARDGVKVPVTLFYRKDLYKADGSNPLMVYGYGSYGLNMPVGFNTIAPSLVDRGLVWAYAHIRGSSFLGRQWYEDGKLLKKQNTFNDFVDVTRYLIDNRDVDAKRVFAWGGSAGGLLMGAVINQAPELYRGVIAAVPFVDVVTTMSDASIPLTTGEYTEWGNPADKPYFDYMLSYSPYDNIRRVEYPNLLITSGLWDSQVQYFEPAKWIAKLRDYHQGDNVLVMKMDMTSGHGGASGRFQRYRVRALAQGFALDLAGQK